MKCKENLILFVASITYAFIISVVAKPVARLISDNPSWILNLSFIVTTYFLVILPIYLIGTNNRFANFFGLHQEIEYTEVKKEETQNNRKEDSRKSKYVKLLMCFFALQASYLTWGILQEKIMTTDYVKFDGTKEKFRDSQFIVFINRVLAFTLSGIILFFQGKLNDRTPLYQYSFCSVSNILSSWFQYEALKYISFPIQVVAKSCKVIPVMVVSTAVSKKSYKKSDYFLALIISLGMIAFLNGVPSQSDVSTATTISGVILLISYLGADSFTSSWQSQLFTTYKQSEIQMMFGVNTMSVLLTTVSLFLTDGFMYSFSFMERHPIFILDCTLTAIASASGQFAIFYTIAEFGPMIFALLMTLRQGLSVLLSCIIYNHVIEPVGILGVVIIFSALIYKGTTSEKKGKSVQSPQKDEVV
ncbi:adenosine 3'-phospho 5'-phosphosulfate transporter 1-like isoform X1 [Artemia franciscana]|uniref:adenosine 3'-phospho 5'-phosphosulfate transporter 1-like isoform X1 n=1 Tax=Artemia franciscana TaxID=6661 RepID=UPI0032DBB5FF